MQAKMNRIKGNFEVGEKQNWNFFNFCNDFLQTENALEEVVKDLLQRLQGWNCVYAEIRFAPVLHTKKGLSYDQILDALIKGTKFRKSSN